jgi:hypothetical protein
VYVMPLHACDVASVAQPHGTNNNNNNIQTTSTSLYEKPCVRHTETSVCVDSRISSCVCCMR